MSLTALKSRRIDDVRSHLLMFSGSEGIQEDISFSGSYTGFRRCGMRREDEMQTSPVRAPALWWDPTNDCTVQSPQSLTDGDLGHEHGA